MKLYSKATPHQIRHMFFFNFGPACERLNGRYVDRLDILHARWKPREPWSLVANGRSKPWGFKRWHDVKHKMRKQYPYQWDGMRAAAPGLHERSRRRQRERRSP